MTAKEEIMYIIEKEHPCLYKRMEREEYEKEHGEHFDEDYAKKAVASMCHKENGMDVCGELIPIDKVKTLIEPYKAWMVKDDTCWDAYVALHMFAHDIGRNYKRRNASGWEQMLSEDAMTWAFNDDDAKDGKIWRYVHAMA